MAKRLSWLLDSEFRILSLDFVKGLTVYQGNQAPQTLPAPDEKPRFTRLCDELAKARPGDPDAFITDAARAGRIMQTIVACYRSAQNGMPVSVTPKDLVTAAAESAPPPHPAPSAR